MLLIPYPTSRSGSSGLWNLSLHLLREAPRVPALVSLVMCCNQSSVAIRDLRTRTSRVHLTLRQHLWLHNHVEGKLFGISARHKHHMVPNSGENRSDELISWHAQKRESRVGRSSLLIHSYIRFIHPKTVLCIPLHILHDGALRAFQWVTIHLFFQPFKATWPASLVTLKECLDLFETHSPTTKNDVRHLWYYRLWIGHDKWPKT